MKKTLNIALVLILLLSGLFILTGCGNNSTDSSNDKNKKELHYDYTGTDVSVKVPEESKYQFTKEKPKNSIYFSGSFYLVGEGEKIAVSFSSDKLFGDGVKTFNDFVTYLKSDKYTGTYEIKEEVKIGGRDAFRMDFRYGSTASDNLYGYTYIVSADGVDDGSFYIINVVKSDFTLGNIAETMTDSGVSSVIESIKFSK